MPVTLPRMPQSVQQALGPEATEDLIQWLEGMVAERAVRRDEAHEVLSRLDVLVHDVSEARAGITDLQRTVDERFDQMVERSTTMIRWTVGTLALFGTIISILLAVAPYM